MLQTLRSRAAGTVAKILFSVLVLSFAVWGIGDYAFLRRGDPTAVTVGSTKVTATELGTAFRREVDRLRQQIGELDPAVARQFGLMDRVVDRVVAQALFDQAASSLGLRIGNDLVRMRILNDATLRGPDGNFDRNAFLEVLQRAGYSEDSFVALVRSQVAQALLTDPLAQGIEVPDVVVDRLYRYRNEKRTGEVLLVPAATFTDVGQPDVADLEPIYEDDRERYTTPEYRDLTVVRIGADEMAKKVQVDDAEVLAEFNRRKPELSVAERRDVEQILLKDEESAKTAAAKIAAGEDFIAVAQEVASQTPETTKLGSIDRSGLLPDLAAAVFALEEGKSSEPVRSPFGWHLFRVTKIEPGREPAFEDLKDIVRDFLARQEAGAIAAKETAKLEDALGARASLEDAAKLIDVPVVKIPEVSAAGLTSAGEAAAIFLNAADVLGAVFDTPEGRETPVLEARSGAYFVVRVDKIVPSRLKPLDEVLTDVEEQWRTRKRSEAAKARAEKILEAVRGGQKLDEAGKEFGLTPEMTPAVRRTIDGTLPQNITPDLVGIGRAHV